MKPESNLSHSVKELADLCRRMACEQAATVDDEDGLYMAALTLDHLYAACSRYDSNHVWDDEYAILKALMEGLNNLLGDR
jgi:hypothetical protein